MRKRKVASSSSSSSGKTTKQSLRQSEKVILDRFPQEHFGESGETRTPTNTKPLQNGVEEPAGRRRSRQRDSTRSHRARWTDSRFSSSGCSGEKISKCIANGREDLSGESMNDGDEHSFTGCKEMFLIANQTRMFPFEPVKEVLHSVCR